MASVSFYLNASKTDSKGNAPIMLQFVNEGKRIYYYTQEKVDPKHWDQGKQKISSKHVGAPEINEYLSSLKADILQVFREARALGKNPTIDYIRNEFLKKRNATRGDDFFLLFEQYLERAESTNTTSTIKNYKNSLHYYKRYRDEKRFSFEFDDLDMAFYDKFISFLVVKVGLANNTTGRVVKVLKTFLNWSTDNGYSRNYEYKKFKIFREEIEIVYLTDKELTKLYKLKVSNTTLAKARDLFCFGCFTGLRFSDTAALKPENIGEDHITLRTQKTKDLLSIPLLPQAQTILARHKNELPKMANQKLNKHVKDLCRLAGITTSISTTRYKGAKRVDITVPKCDLITTHTARRTFITLSLEKGLRPEIVMKITGHKNFKTMEAYIKIVESVSKDEMFRAWGNNALKAV